MGRVSELLNSGRDLVSAAEAWELVRAGALLLDVRTPQEFAAGAAPGATLIPVQELPARLAEIPREREIVAYCRSGARSGAAAQILRDAGYTAINAGGVAAMIDAA